jgi:hypothetical protein
MPRNRKRKPPADPVNALVRWLDREALKPNFEGKVKPQAQVSCGHCKAMITSIRDHEDHVTTRWGVPRFRLDTYGHRWDGDVWHPTPYRRRLWQQVREAAPVSESASQRLRTNRYLHRSIWRRDMPQGAGEGRTAELREANALPTKWECSSCSQINIIDVD